MRNNGPETQEELLQVIKGANDNDLLDQESFETIERLFHVGELKVRDVMIPRSQMVVVNKNDSPEKMLPTIIESAHSRFPVVDGDEDEVLGILLAKDLLKYFDNPDADFLLRDVLRKALYIPESKRLNVLLKEFQESRTHMAVVVNEHSIVSGLVTIEDVIEQIIGDIEDEHDFDEEENMIKQHSEKEYTMNARLPIEDFDERFNTNFEERDCDTIGGLILAETGRFVKRGEKITIDNYTFEILNADSRHIHLLKLTF